MLISLCGVLCCYVGALLVLPLHFATSLVCYERVFGLKEEETAVPSA
jgi:hypothetical protein